MDTDTEAINAMTSAKATDLAREAEALATISRAMSDLPADAASRVAAWTKSLAPDEDHLIKAVGHLATEVRKYIDAVTDHYRQNSRPSRADAQMYVAILGHDNVSRAVLAALYASEPEPSEIGELR